MQQSRPGRRWGRSGESPGEVGPGSYKKSYSSSTSQGQPCAGPAVSIVANPSPHLPAGWSLLALQLRKDGSSEREAPAQGHTAKKSYPQQALTTAALPASKEGFLQKLRAQEGFLNCSIIIAEFRIPSIYRMSLSFLALIQMVNPHLKKIMVGASRWLSQLNV